jgi:DNA-binding PadR family transcriptional regulator
MRMAELQPMTEAMYYILLSLLQPGYGYGMMQRIRELSGGRVEMGPGTLYGVLTRMKKDGLIVLTSQEERRKNYEITELGREALRQEYDRLKRLVHDGKILEEEQ